MPITPNDPVYIVIERHRRACAEFIAAATADDSPAADDARKRELTALEALGSTQPASLDGCTTLLYYIANDMADREDFDWSRVCANVATALSLVPQRR
jgi:hypothetical protein